MRATSWFAISSPMLILIIVYVLNLIAWAQCLQNKHIVLNKHVSLICGSCRHGRKLYLTGSAYRKPLYFQDCRITIRSFHCHVTASGSYPSSCLSFCFFSISFFPPSHPPYLVLFNAVVSLCDFEGTNTNSSQPFLSWFYWSAFWGTHPAPVRRSNHGCYLDFSVSTRNFLDLSQAED